MGLIFRQTIDLDGSSAKKENPTNPFDTVQLPDPRFLNQANQANVPVPELERRQAHMSLIEPTHPLLPIARHCLKDRDVERPSSQQLYQTMDALKGHHGTRKAPNKTCNRCSERNTHSYKQIERQ